MLNPGTQICLPRRHCFREMRSIHMQVLLERADVLRIVTAVRILVLAGGF